MLANTNETYILYGGKFTGWLELKEHNMNDRHDSITGVEQDVKTGL
jgi:hypothetical protein